MEVPIELCTSAHVYRPDSVRRMLLLAVLVAIYSFSIPYCYMTAGEPRRIAMIQAQKLSDEKWAAEVNFLSENGTLSMANSTLDFQPTFVETDVGAPKTQESPVYLTDEFGSVDDSPDSGFGEKSEKAKSANWLMSWFGPSLEQKRAKAEFDKWQKEFKEKSGDTISLPPEYLPSAWACLAIFMTLSLHALFHLMCHWIVKFKALTLYKPAEKVDEECFVLIVPPANRGSAALVPMKKSTLMGSNSTLYAEFQRQKYVYTPAAKLGDNAKKYKTGIFTLSAYPVNLAITQYLEARGIPSEGEIAKLTEKWGKNHLAVAIPSFFELLRLQLLSPLAIFQVFCAVLWLLDEYWTYTLFSLFSVVMYEATTVFQRTRTQQMLGGMAPKPSPIYAYRCGRWSMITTKDLLPGDIISLAFKKRASAPSVVPATPATPAATPVASGTVATPAAADTTVSEPENKSSVTSMDEMVPCDCLLLRGSAVVNEASLTGESVPQMKEAVTKPEKNNANNSEERLDITGTHRVSALFSGTSLVTVTGVKKAINASTNKDKKPAATEDSFADIPLPPDGGATAYVLRTGFGSSQGSLLQMIEFSQQSVTGDVKETGLALLVLFIFALMASGYVLKEGLRKKEKTTHELLLKCVIIITSVVPRQFPMQMAVAVNMALMALSKAGVFCTEPYRVPLAGKVSHCLFDKTGTITTDQLVPAGIINFNSSNINAGEETSNSESVLVTSSTSASHNEENNGVPKLYPVTSASAETAMILAACHSLVVLDDDNQEATTAAAAGEERLKPPNTNNLTGDPIELAAIRAIEWSWDGLTSTASPDGAVKRHQYGLMLARRELQRLTTLPVEERGASYQRDLASAGQDIERLQQKHQASKQKAAASALYNSVQVLQRHHFSSALQRMSVVVRCSNSTTNSTGNTSSSTSSSSSNTSSSSSSEHWYCLVKGSPEALQQLILPENLPTWYAKTYEHLARRGLRVLALGYKKVSSKDRPQDQSRTWVEKDLFFGGFIAFECKIRADSGLVIQSLLRADHKVAMLTGDALLTSLHVAKQVGICDAKKENLVLLKNTSVDSMSEKDAFVWQFTDKEDLVERQQSQLPFTLETVEELGRKYNLLTTEDVFVATASAFGGAKTSRLWSYAGLFKVFARMSPQGKANVIRAIQEADKDHHVFMCGDGGNDVGALKQVMVVFF